MAYLFIGGVSGLFNLALFLGGLWLGYSPAVSALASFFLAAALNYVLCILLLFRHRARWNTPSELAIYLLVVCLVGILDVGLTKSLIEAGLAPYLSKCTATLIGLLLNFAARRLLVFPEASSGPWKKHDQKIGSAEKAIPESEH
jgi:putative flippase GtrA